MNLNLTNSNGFEPSLLVYFLASCLHRNILFSIYATSCLGPNEALGKEVHIKPITHDSTQTETKLKELCWIKSEMDWVWVLFYQTI